MMLGLRLLRSFQRRLRTAEPVPDIWVGAPVMRPGVLQSAKDEASVRARILFEALLCPKELQQWRTESRVTVRLPYGRWAMIGSGRIEWDDARSQCVLPDQQMFGVMPREDIYIAQLLHLRNDPDVLRAVGGLPSVKPGGGPSSVHRPYS